MRKSQMELVAEHMNFVKEVEEALRKVSKLKMYQMDSSTHKLLQFRRDFQEAIDVADGLLKGMKNESE